MALMGMKKKQAFGQVPGMAQPVMQPAYGQANSGIGQLPDITNMPEIQQSQQPAKRGPSWLGILGDSLQILGGGQASYVPQMQEQRQRALERQQERETGWQDWVKKQEYNRANPEPANNDTVNDVRWFMGATPEERAAYREMNPEYRQGPDGKFYRISSQPAPDISQGLPPGFKVKGGQTPPASGNFPNR